MLLCASQRMPRARVSEIPAAQPPPVDDTIQPSARTTRRLSAQVERCATRPHRDTPHRTTVHGIARTGPAAEDRECRIGAAAVRRAVRTADRRFTQIP
ncbi:hypothetical protein BEK98_08940 [Streptomyces diastatochromogenes]|uniref:Uncharacterized protein n=1 Tax=Streptomyces diastatochromogenes TaxID=42236 RepID=A0A233SPT2_STRDA|nr:hypothetical protein BEK98_08940 [Streptomyces diastatochromogenes]